MYSGETTLDIVDGNNIIIDGGNYDGILDYCIVSLVECQSVRLLRIQNKFPKPKQ